MKKKQKRVLVSLLLLLFAYCIWQGYGESDLLSNEDFIRFHVIANSDGKADQALKLKVRDRLLTVINEDLVAETMAKAGGDQKNISLNLDGAMDYIENNLEKIEDSAKEVICEEGYDYPVTADLGVSLIPKKSYGDLTFPAGNYRSLNIIIGEGKGENWWCVLFPPLCLIGEENEEEDIYKDVLLNEKYNDITKGSEHQRTLKLKFKTLELLSK